jgi:hypothetical protein
MNSKTRKRREKPNTEITPIISPNLLKTKLLKRIKEHKQNEFEKLNAKESKDTIEINPTFTDEFNDSLHYLQSLAKEKKIKEEKDIKQKQYEALQRKTLKNYHTPSLSSPYVNIDLPEELIDIPSENLLKPIILAKHDDVPYGILKGGTKPTYSQWNKTKKANISFATQSSVSVNDREKRLQLLREKIQQNKLQLHAMSEPQMPPSQLHSNSINDTRQLQSNHTNDTLLPPSTSLTQMPFEVSSPLTQMPFEVSSPLTQMPFEVSSPLPQTSSTLLTSSHLSGGNIIDDPMLSQNMIKKSIQPIDNGIKKKITTKTIKKKYTLGKSNVKRQIGILLKDHATRKNIITAQRELKRKPVQEIKQYLREHNLIKIGTTAPNDVLRKMYENAMLAGDINNSNVDTLLHNLSNETGDK